MRACLDKVGRQWRLEKSMSEYDNLNSQWGGAQDGASYPDTQRIARHSAQAQQPQAQPSPYDGASTQVQPANVHVSAQEQASEGPTGTERIVRNQAPVAPAARSQASASPASTVAQEASAYVPATTRPATEGYASYTQQQTAAQTRSSATRASSGASASARATQSAPRATAQKKGHAGLKTFLLGFLGAALAFGLLSFITNAWGGGAKQENVSQPSTTLGAAQTTTVAAKTTDDSLAEAVAEKVLPSIAAIDTYANQGNYGSFWGYGGSSSGGNSLQALGLGSGVVIGADGYILTNYHVVEGAEKVMVTVEGQEYEGEVAGTDPASDLAVIKVNAPNALTAVEIGSSSDLKPGQWVMTLGSPFGLEQSVATGIVSAVSRTVVMGSSNYSYGGQSEAASIYANMIQTDAAINPGNSGGALVDENGRLIGINSVIESYSGSYSGVGFAIPIDYAINIAQQIIDGKVPTHAQLGVATTTIDSSLAERYKLGADKGAYISKVYDNSGAAEAGLQVGDIIVKLGDATIETSSDVVAAVRAHSVGDTVSLTYMRDGQENTVDVVLGSDENATITAGQEDERLQELYDYFGNNGGGSSPHGDSGSNGGGSYNYNLDDLLEYFGYGAPGGSTQQGNAA